MESEDVGRFEGLARFVEAQGLVYPGVLGELRRGLKTGHWMWFIFPQLRGLGRSSMAERYGLASLEEARGYLVHPVLGPRLHECVGLVLGSGAPTAEAIFGSLDAMKLRSSMTVFVRADPDDRSFRAIIDRYFDGRPDPLTDRLLAASSG